MVEIDFLVRRVYWLAALVLQHRHHSDSPRAELWLEEFCSVSSDLLIDSSPNFSKVRNAKIARCPIPFSMKTYIF